MHCEFCEYLLKFIRFKLMKIKYIGFNFAFIYKTMTEHVCSRYP